MIFFNDAFNNEEVGEDESTNPSETSEGSEEEAEDTDTSSAE